MGLHWDAERRFELGAAHQQPDVLPTEARRTFYTEPLGLFDQTIEYNVANIERSASR